MQNLSSFCCHLLGKELFARERVPLALTGNFVTGNNSSRYEPFPATDVQQAYLFGRKGYVDLGNVSCFSYQEYDCPPNFDRVRLEQAFNYLIQRHETLRIIFPSETEQKILENVPYYTIVMFDLNNHMPAEEQLLKRRSQLSHQVRPANQWPLFDIQVSRLIVDSKHQYRLHIAFDLLILDLWSLNLILFEMNELYHNPNAILTTISLSYRDYILAEHQLKDMFVYKNDRLYWINRLPSFPLGPSLPLRCLPNELEEQRFIGFRRTLDRSVWLKLKHRISSAQLSPAGFLAAVYAIVLAKWSENKHFSVNLPIFHRLPIHAQINQITGDFTSIIPLEIDLNQPIVFEQFVRTVQKQLWNDLEHMSYSGVSFIRELMHKNNTRKIVLPIVFTCGINVSDSNHNTGSNNILFEKPPVYGISQTPQVYLDNQVYEEDGHLLIDWDNVENLFPSEMINDMQGIFADLLHRSALSDDIWQNPVFISLTAEQQRRRLAFNETTWKPNVKANLLHIMVIEQAERTPNAWAVFSSRGNLTYKQLMNRSHSLAHHLRLHGAQSNQLFVILMQKGWEQIVACLAVLVSGAAYLPLDIDAPHDRLCALIGEADAKIILTQSNVQLTFPHLTIIPVDTFTVDIFPKPLPIRPQLPTDLAYVIYTSGSSGKPKGVMISHQAVVNTVLDMNSRLEISSEDRIFALSHLNFDLSVYDIFGMLTAGGCIVIPDHEHYKSPKHWYKMMIEHQITIWNSVPMLMQMLVEHLEQNHNDNQLRHILLSGDWIPLSLPKSIETTFGKQMTITSLGGATEASIWSIAYTLPKEIPKEWKSIPYGLPLRNQHCYVYDSHLNNCPEWVNGELYIGGMGLADGYWKDQKKTESSFITHPHTHERLYRTGDYGHYVPNGYIEFIGRMDSQVKLHGYRIELGEIEYHLQQHPDIHQAIVTLDSKSQRFVGYFIPEKHSTHVEDYDESEISITDPIERINFKLTTRDILRQDRVKKSFPLKIVEQTDMLIDVYYARKSYRQFTNEIIEKSDIEHLLRKPYCTINVRKNSPLCLNFDSLSQFLSVLTPVVVSDQPLPKYRYASAGSLYCVQAYIELLSAINDIPPGLYYHNPDKHSLELISEYINCDNVGVHFHLVGRSAAIAPLYGKTLGSRLSILETGYIIGFLQNEAGKIGWNLSSISNAGVNEQQNIKLGDNDTHHSFSISPVEKSVADYRENDRNYPDCFVYFKPSGNNMNQWFIYDKDNSILSPIYVESSTELEKPSLFFTGDDETKAIFNDCRVAIFFVGQSEQRMNTGIMAHLLMNAGLEMNIGMCPIGSRTSLPSKINSCLDEILTRHRSHRENLLLHILLLGNISDQQKYERTISTIKPMPDVSHTLETYLSANLPGYMVPSLFIAVQTFPLGPNGKVDRKALCNLSSTVRNRERGYEAPGTELEKTITSIWQELLYTDRNDLKDGMLDFDKQSLFTNTRELSTTDTLDSSPSNRDKNLVRKFLSTSDFSRLSIATAAKQSVCVIQSQKNTNSSSCGALQNVGDQISTTTSFFSLGGHSLLLIKLYHQYQTLFGFDAEALPIRQFFRHSTIADHAKLLGTNNLFNQKSKVWKTLKINEGNA
jgi:amino acid adenylation domain-containing protein